MTIVMNESVEGAVSRPASPPLAITTIHTLFNPTSWPFRKILEIPLE